MSTATLERGDRIALQVNSAADATGFSRTTLYAAMACGELPFIQIGASRRIMVSDLETWLLRHRVASDAVA